MGLVNGRGQFSTPHSSKTPGPICMKLEIYNCFPNTTPHAKFQGPMSTCVVWENSQFDAWKFLSFFPFIVTPTGRIFGHIPTLNTSLCVVPAKEVPFGGPPLPPKNVKIWTLSWRSMENCSRPNSGTVSRIMFKLGTRIDHPSGITWHDSKVKRSKSQRNVTYPVKNCNNSVLGGRIKFILGS